MALPTNVNYGTVVGQFLLAYADSADVDPQPDGVPAKGSIFFRPSPIKLLDGSSSPNPVTILPAVVEATLDPEGYLCGYGTTRGIRLVATDDPDLNPQDWTWTVEFRLTAQDDTPVAIPSFNIELPSDTTVDLTTASPVPDANGTYYLVGPQGPTGATGPQGPSGTIAVGTVTTGTAGGSASVTNVGTSTAAVFDFVIPQGIQGEQGPIGPQGETGPIGPTGATGIEWQGTWSETTDYVNNDAVFYNGASWFAAGDPPAGQIPSEASPYWFPLALQGATGPTGPQGPQGEIGPQGPIGPEGPQGLQGPAATITVGTVTTGAPGTSVVINNVGTTTDAIFDFTIPKGDTGDLGSLSASSPITYSSNTIGLDYNALVIDGGTA